MAPRASCYFVYLFLLVISVPSGESRGWKMRSKPFRKSLQDETPIFSEGHHESSLYDHGLNPDNFASSKLRTDFYIFEGRNYSGVSEAISRLATSLYREINLASPTNESKAFSPVSVYTELAMLFAGAGGNTATEIRKILTTDSGMTESELYLQLKNIIDYLNSQSSVSLVVANHLFVQEEIEPKEDYLDILGHFFGAGVDSIDFTDPNSAAQKIVAWGSKRAWLSLRDTVTNETINPERTKMMLISAMNFKAKWRFPFFHSKHTKEDRFYLDPKNENETFVMLPFMQNKVYFDYVKLDDLEAEAVILPLRGERFVMIALLPQVGMELADLETKIGNGYDLIGLPSKFKNSEVVELHFPKFRIESGIQFLDNNTNILSKIGLENLASATANFSKISDNLELKPTDFVHKTVIQLSEGGAEVQSNSPVLFSRPPEVKFNRPFFGYVMDLNSGVILFMFRKTN